MNPKTELAKLRKLRDSLPKTADGYPAAPGMKLWFAGSLDSIRGPHQILVKRISMEQCSFEADEGFGWETISVDWDTVYASKMLAESSHASPSPQPEALP